MSGGGGGGGGGEWGQEDKTHFRAMPISALLRASPTVIDLLLGSRTQKIQD